MNVPKQSEVLVQCRVCSREEKRWRKKPDVADLMLLRERAACFFGHLECPLMMKTLLCSPLLMLPSLSFVVSVRTFPLRR